MFFIKTVKAICTLLKNEIKWPTTLLEQKIILVEFQTCRKDPFPYVIGCIDVTHIRIQALKKDLSSYYDRNGQYSIIAQAICDSKFRFLDIFVGYPGSCHDANVWRNNPIGKALFSGTLCLTENAHLLEDSANPLASFMMVPHRDNGHLSTEQRQFNYYLSATRVCIEQAFGILKKKFQILDHIDVKSLCSVKSIVVACFILHNYILNREEISPDDQNCTILANIGNVDEDNYSESNTTEAGRRKRDNITILFAA